MKNAEKDGPNIISGEIIWQKQEIHEYLVQTSFQEEDGGLNRECVERAVEILNK